MAKIGKRFFESNKQLNSHGCCLRWRKSICQKTQLIHCISMVSVTGAEPSRIRRKTNLRECPVAEEADWGLCFMITLSFDLCNRSKLESVPASHSSCPMFYKYLNPSMDNQKEKKPSLLTRKSRKRLACNAPHAGHANDVTDLVKMGLLLAIQVSQFSNLFNKSDLKSSKNLL